jgi:hypothetical protein
MPVDVVQTCQPEPHEEYKHAYGRDEQLGIGPTGVPPITRGSDVVSA